MSFIPSLFKADQEIIDKFKPLFKDEGFSVTFVDRQEELANLKEIKLLNHESMVLLLA